MERAACTPDGVCEQKALGSDQVRGGLLWEVIFERKLEGEISLGKGEKQLVEKRLDIKGPRDAGRTRAGRKLLCLW